MDLILKISVGIAISSMALLVFKSVINRDPPVLTTQDLIRIAAIDDPKLGTIPPDALKASLSNKDTFVIYLPECLSCTSKEPLPEVFPPDMDQIVFVKRTNEEIPKAVGSNRLIIDDEGNIERILNAYRTPRIYLFSDGRLKEIQKLSESWSDYLQGRQK